MSDRRPNIGRARLNVEADTYTAMCAVLALELACINPRSKAIRELPKLIRDAVWIKAAVVVNRASWPRRAWWAVLRYWATK